MNFNSKSTNIEQSCRCGDDAGRFGAQLIPLLMFTLFNGPITAVHDKMDRNNKSTISLC